MKSFPIPGDVGFCNAVRRTLLQDVMMWAPSTVTVRTNTSCQTDEYIAHRIGLIPFRRVGNGDTVEFTCTGPQMATTAHVRGPAFEPVHEIDVMLLADDQCIDLTIHMEHRKASTHARYSPCAAVGMKQLDSNRHEISFRSIDGRDEREVLLEALDRLDDRVAAALLQLANQPAQPPKTMC